MIRILPLRTPTLPPATTTNCVVLGRREVVLVDPATPHEDERGRLSAWLERAGCTVRAIVLTHHHADHVGAAAWIARRRDAPILATRRTAELLEGTVAVSGFLAEGDRVEVDDGAWRVLETPGHATGHLCLLDAAGENAVVGDMVAGEGTIVLDPPEGRLADYLASLERLAGLGPRRLVPAHGRVLEDGPATLAEYLAHRHVRTGQVVEALREHDGPARPIDLVPPIYPELPRAFHPVAARQVLAHLQWLAERGEAIELEDGRWVRA